MELWTWATERWGLLLIIMLGYITFRRELQEAKARAAILQGYIDISEKHLRVFSKSSSKDEALREIMALIDETNNFRFNAALHAAVNKPMFDI